MEAKPFLETLPESEVHICGWGMKEIESFLSSFLPTLQAGKVLCLCGIAGRCNDTLKEGDVVFVEEEYDVINSRKSYPTLKDISLTGVKSSTVEKVNTAHPESDLENMEGSIFFEMCEKFKIPAFEIRAISNHVASPRNEWQIDLALNNLTVFLKQQIL